MIVRERDGQVVLVRQADHDDQCGRMATFLDAELFPSAEVRRSFVQAAFLHDNGWDAWEEHPHLQRETGRPMLFTRLDAVEWCALYREGIALAVEADPLAGLLVSMHGLGLRRSFLGIRGAADWRATGQDEDPEVERFCEEQELLQAELIAGLQSNSGMAPVVAGCVLPPDDGSAAPRPLTYGPTLMRLYKLIEFLDALSLRLAWRGLSEEPFWPVPDVDEARADHKLTARKQDDHTVALAPFPFATSPLAVPMVARVLPDRSYDSDAEFQAAFMAAQPELLRFALVAG